MRTKINELICQISGVETEPFRRYVGKINVNELIDVITKEKEISEKKGYRNLELSVEEDTGIIDIYLYGDRDLTEEELDLDERIAVISRVKDKTSKGMTRDDLLNQKKMSKEEISKVLRNNLKVVPKAYDMQGENFNSDCHMEITNKAYQIIGEGDIDKGKNIVDEYLKETNGQL